MGVELVPLVSLPLREEAEERMGDIGCGDSKLRGGRNGGPAFVDDAFEVPLLLSFAEWLERCEPCR